MLNYMKVFRDLECLDEYGNISVWKFGQMRSMFQHGYTFYNYTLRDLDDAMQMVRPQNKVSNFNMDFDL